MAKMAARCILAGLLFAVTAGAGTHGSDDAGDGAVVPLFDASGKLVCSGVVVGAHTVLTAAHCMIDGVSFDQFRAGTQALSDALVEPGFDQFAHDLALLTLREPATVT